MTRLTTPGSVIDAPRAADASISSTATVRAGIARYAAGAAASAAVLAALTLVADLREGPGYDYVGHAALARRWLDTGQPPTPHFLYELLSIAGHLLTGADLVASGIAVAVGSSAALGLILYTLVIREAALGPSAAAGITLTLGVAGPLSFITLPARNLYLGYVPVTVYHNPTMTLLKPLAVLVFVLVAVGLLRGGSALPSLVLAGLSVLSTLAKPNLAICLVPAVLLVSAARAARGHRAHWGTVGFGLVLPVTLTLVAQLALVRLLRMPTITSGVDFAPLAFYQETLAAHHRPGLLLPKFLASVLFPVAVLAAYRRDAISDLRLILAWIVFGLGALYAYFLVEQGAARADGNFTWSGQIALFLLFVASALLLVRKFEAERWSPRLTICASILGVHAAAGLLFLVSQATPRFTGWW